MVTLDAEAFNRGDLLPGNLAKGSLARPYRFAVDMNRASTAQAGAAAEFCAGHLQLFADGPEQRCIWRCLDGHIPSIDVKIRHALSSPAGA
jgi:hypothetical protein